jgi:hypothetical protein
MNQKLIIYAIAAGLFAFMGFYSLLYFDYVYGVAMLMVTLLYVFLTFQFIFEEHNKREP